MLPSARSCFARLLLVVSVAASIIIVGAPRADASAITIPVASNVPGNGMGDDPFSSVGDTNGNRYQEIFASSFFTSLDPEESITSVAFRPKQGAFLSFIGSDLVLSDLIVRLSTTTKTPDNNASGLNANLDLNVGADVTTVFEGPITLTTTRKLGDSGVGNFDFLITFQTPFLYQPSLGNLLLEVITPAGATVKSNGNNFPELDNETDAFPSMDGVASATDANLLDGSSVGTDSTTGAVAQFTATAVPEPGTLALFATGLGGLIAAARRRHRS